jgi:hypothetical protein
VSLITTVAAGITTYQPIDVVLIISHAVSLQAGKAQGRFIVPSMVEVVVPKALVRLVQDGVAMVMAIAVNNARGWTLRV